MDNKNPEPIRKLLIQKFVQMITAQIAFFSTLWLFFSETFGRELCFWQKMADLFYIHYCQTAIYQTTFD